VKPDRGGPLRLLVITGLSGSGKTHVSRALEDVGWFCVDNLPIALIPPFADLIRRSPELRRSALVVDVRERGFLRQFPAVYARLKKAGLGASLLFFEADERTLLRRFSETRRPHPLGDFNQPPLESIREERERLRAIRAAADLILDTSDYTVHQLRDYIRQRYDLREDRRTLAVTVMSFGYRHGVPSEADLVFDVRFLPNPHFVPRLRRLTGQDRAVVRYLERQPETRRCLARLRGFIAYVVPRFRKEGKSHLTIAIGCTGGRHRSVMVAEALGRRLSAKRNPVNVRHRDLRLS
jgi:UPF0042 nucleotide-binding protein